MSADRVPLIYACLYSATPSDMHVGSFIHIRMFVKCCSLKQGIWSLTNSSDIPTGRMPLPCLLWVCHFPIGILGQVRYLIVSIPDLCTLTYFVKLVGYHPGRHLENIKFWWMHLYHHWDVTTIMFVIQVSVKLAFCMRIPGVCLSQGRFSYIFVFKLPPWRQSCLHFIFFLFGYRLSVFKKIPTS